jgi:high mobility group protein B1
MMMQNLRWNESECTKKSKFNKKNNIKFCFKDNKLSNFHLTKSIINMTDLKQFIHRYESLTEHGQEEFRRRMHKPTGKKNSEERRIKELEEQLERMTSEEREAFRHQIQDGDGKKFKDPDAPKKGSNAYIQYSKAETARLKEETEGLSHSDAFSLAATHWKALSEEERGPWEELAEQDKARYEKEMAAYTPSPDVLLKLQSQVGKKKRAKRDPNHPKQGLNSYFQFSIPKRAELQKDGMSGKEAIQEVKRLWGDFADDEKKPFVDLAAKDKVRYDKEMAAYKAGGDEEAKEAPKKKNKRERQEEEKVETPKKTKKTTKKTTKKV